MVHRSIGPQGRLRDSLLLALATLAMGCPRPAATPGGVAAPSGGGDAITISGRLSGRSLGSARIAIAWVVSAGSPDYVYLHGTGHAQGDRFSVRLDGPPPPDALNAGRLGVGLLVLLPDRTAVPQGRLPRRQWRALTRRALGGAPRYGLIYRRGRQGFRGNLDWVRSFPQGYGCGRGRPRPGRTFDSFSPVRCDSFRVIVAPFPQLHWVNWT